MFDSALIASTAAVVALCTELGRVWSWGDNSRGQLGQGLSAAALASDSALQTSPALIPSLAARRCSWVSAGWSHSACILDSIAAADNAGSTLFTFGCNARSQLGLGTASSSKQLPRLDQPTEVVALRGPGVAQVACGGRHTLVLTNEGRVCAFGDNAHGQLGVGDLQSKAQPTTVKAFTAEAAASADEPLLCSTVCAGWRHSLFVSLDRKSIHAAGSNSLGELGIGIGAGESSSSSSSSASARSSTKFSRPVPVRLPDAFNSSSSSIRRVSCGWSHNIVLSSSGELFGWGRADFGALATKPTGTDAAAGVNAGEGGGGGSKSSKSVPLPVSISLPASLAAEPSLALDVACGSEHTVLLTATDVFVCGWNEHGNLGLGHNRDRNDEDTFAFTPIPQLHLDEPIPRRVVTGGAAVMILEP